jgi:hypothetical protein
MTTLGLHPDPDEDLDSTSSGGEEEKDGPSVSKTAASATDPGSAGILN